MDLQFEARPTSLLTKAAMLVGLAVLGAAFGYGVAQFVDLRPGDIGWEDGLALTLALVLLATAAAIGVTMVVKPTAVPAGTAVVQIVVFVLAGLMFLAPMIAPAYLDTGLVFAGIVVAFAIQTWANVIAWRRADEMIRRVMTETSTIAFWGLQSVFFLYAAAERMGLVGSVSTWGLMGILMAVYLVSSIVPSIRRGLT